MVRVAFLQASLGVGGAERLVQSLMRGLDRERFATAAVNLYSPGPVGEQLFADGFEVVSGLARGRFDPAAGRRLHEALERQQARVVYVPDSALPLFWAGWLRRRRPPWRLVVGFHSTGKVEDAFQHRIAAGSAFPVTDRFVALAESHERYLVAELHVDPLRTEVIGSGVDLERFHPPADRLSAKRAAGFDADEPLVGIVAALRPEKHHALFLRMASRVARRIPAARFLIIGAGPERPRLEGLTRDLRLHEQVRFLGVRDDIPELYRALDVAVLCSLPVVETYPVSLLEALASGVPVVSTRVGSIADLVDGGVTGTLVASGDEAALAEEVERLLADAARRERMGRAARAAAQARFDRAAMIAAYARLFEQVAR